MVAARPSEPDVGLPLGPDSLTWRWFADGRQALLGPRAAVLQNMLPALGQGVQDHSVWFDDTLARLRRSVPPIFKVVYGAEPGRTGRQVRDLHLRIRGDMPDGSPYAALDPDTFYWAHACFVEHLVIATDRFIRRLTEAEKDRLVRESVTWFARYDVPAPFTPASWAEFDAWFGETVRTRLVRHRIAAYGVGYATRGWPRPARVHPLLWWLLRRPLDAVGSSLTIGGLPPIARDILGLPWDARRERRYQRFATACRRVAPLIDRVPGRWRLHPIAARAYER